jgi:ribonuclease VapC
MIVVDTSALMAIVLDEPAADGCIRALESNDELLISAGTLAESLVVATRRNVLAEMHAIVDGIGLEIVPVTAMAARFVARAYGRWGKGLDPANLNFGACFAYVLAKECGCPLLYVGDDFVHTDIAAAT